MLFAIRGVNIGARAMNDYLCDGFALKEEVHDGIRGLSGSRCDLLDVRRL